MKKDLIRDYATEAFRTYARLGCPSSTVSTGDAALDADITAVQRTLRQIVADGGDGIVAAVRAVYFTAAEREIAKGDISARVERFAAEYYVSVRSVYGWLQKARLRFAKERGLRVK